MYFTLNNSQWLICNKTHVSKQPTTSIHESLYRPIFFSFPKLEMRFNV